MARASVYLETSVVSYYTARPSREVIVLAHQRITHSWWREVLPKCEAYVSELVMQEAAMGDPDAARKRLDAMRPFAMLDITDEAEHLAGVYLRRIPTLASSSRDALHLAIASSSGMDYLLTWNCAHIASGVVRRALEEANDSESIGTPTICTPEELMELRR